MAGPDGRSVLPDARRVCVVGSPGSGKTVFAQRLAGATGLPLHHLDDLYWQPGWQRTPDDDWRRLLARLVAEPRWIIDGNYAPTLEIRIAASDAVVLVDTPTLRCAARFAWRTLRISLGSERHLPARLRGAAERANPPGDWWPLMRKIFGFRRRARGEIFALAARHGVPIVRVPGTSAARPLLDELGAVAQVG